MEIKITDNSQVFKDAKNEAVQRALEAIGLTAERYAKADCPVDTGLLRNSITHTVSGQEVTGSYQASFGSNRYTSGKNAGKRYSAFSKNAGSVAFGRYRGSIGAEGAASVYIGTNVEYAKYVELKDSLHHNTGKAH